MQLTFLVPNPMIVEQCYQQLLVRSEASRLAVLRRAVLTSSAVAHRAWVWLSSSRRPTSRGGTGRVTSPTQKGELSHPVPPALCPQPSAALPLMLPPCRITDGAAVCHRNQLEIWAEIPPFEGEPRPLEGPLKPSL